MAPFPADVRAIVREFRTAELSTLASDGTPITWPVLPFYDDAQGTFTVTTSIALDQKMINARRNPKVALFFSDPTASGLSPPSALLVQGDATAIDEVATSIDGLEALLEQTYRRQPAAAMLTRTPLMRWLFDWYFMRLTMTITPTRWCLVAHAHPTDPSQPREGI